MANEKRIEVYRDRGLRKWRWRVRGRNGRIVGASEQGYVRKSYCVKTAIEENPGLPVVER